MAHFKEYLAKQSTSENLEPGSEFFGGSVDCFLAVAARKLIDDGMTVEQIAHLYTSAAIETLSRQGGRMGREAAKEVSAIADSFFIDDR